MSLERILRFAGVSGAGLALDYLLYTALCELGLAAGWANLISAATAVTFVFGVSVRRVFDSQHERHGRLFGVYAVYQVIAVSAASWAVGYATHALDGRYLLGKTVILPLSFSANYLFMSWLLSTRDPRRT